MRNRSAFTVVDLVVALAILAVILTTVYAVFANHGKAARAVDESRNLYGQASVILDRMSRDLDGAWLPEITHDGGISYAFDARTDGVDFTSTAAMTLDQTFGPEIVEVGYRTEPSGESPGERLILVRRQDDTPDGDPAGGGRDMILTRDLVSLTLTYFGADGREQEEWRTRTASGLPGSIRIAIVLASDAGTEETFETVASPALALPPARKINVPDVMLPEP